MPTTASTTFAAFRQITPHLVVHQGSTNVGILYQGSHALLIDCGAGDVQTTLDALGIDTVEYLLFTHHHRDHASGLYQLAQPATQIGVPSSEVAWFTEVNDFWQKPEYRWHLYNLHPHQLMLPRPVEVHFEFAHGHVLHWGPATLTAISTPGHTEGSLSYLVEVDGLRLLFSGDLIYAPGQLWDLYSLQKAEAGLTDYHGFLGARHELRNSCAIVKQLAPDLLLPTHGEIISKPVEAVDLLLQRLDDFYDLYVAIAALRHYFPAMFAAYAGKPAHMSPATMAPAPDFLYHINTTWMIRAASGASLVMDCAGDATVAAIVALQQAQLIAGVTALWVTHYHDDHVDGMPALQAVLDAPTRTTQTVAQVITAPTAYRLPCISPAVVRIDETISHAQSWHWEEFTLTAYDFPGQTFYHNALLVEGQGYRLLFAGDSFTPTGIDDYCSGNRNLLGEEAGYLRCLDIVEAVQPTHIFNCHVAQSFCFTPAELQTMRNNLHARSDALHQLLPWPDPNFGLDEHWLQIVPYEQTALPGVPVHLTVQLTNHDAATAGFECTPILPPGWRAEPASASKTLTAKSTAQIPFILTPPSTPSSDATIVIPFDITFAGRRLGQICAGVLRGTTGPWQN
jgi:glyoxylase-like metal-dependent hydrolase (beta-lactamase superfamily II)